MKIAEVYHERSKEYYRQENAKEYAYITADEYQPEDVVAMEKRILFTLNFRMDSPQLWHSIMLLNELMPSIPKECLFLSKVRKLIILSFWLICYFYTNR